MDADPPVYGVKIACRFTHQICALCTETDLESLCIPTSWSLCLGRTTCAALLAKKRGRNWKVCRSCTSRVSGKALIIRGGLSGVKPSGTGKAGWIEASAINTPVLLWRQCVRRWAFSYADYL